MKDGAMPALAKYAVSTVLFEGPERGQETSYQRGKYPKAVRTLAKNDVRVPGCEDAKSLGTLGELENLIANASALGAKVFSQRHDALLNKRMPDANDSWVAQALEVKPKVIICCGTSHLPKFNDVQHGHVGIVEKPHQKGMCYGFAAEPSNTGSPFWCVPEKATGSYGRVEAIDEYPGWEKY